MVVHRDLDAGLLGQGLHLVPISQGRLTGDHLQSHRLGEGEHLVPISRFLSHIDTRSHDLHLLGGGQLLQLLLRLRIQVEVKHLVAPLATQLMAGIDLDVVQAQLLGLVQRLHQRELMEAIRLDGQPPSLLLRLALGRHRERHQASEHHQHPTANLFHTHILI